MNLLQAWMHTPLAKGLGWTLFHFLWEGAAIAALLGAALFVCRRAAARVRYGLACLALAAMPVAFGITLAVSLPARVAHFPVPAAVMAAEEWTASPAGPAVAARAPLADRLAWAGPVWMVGVLGIFLFRLGGWRAAQRLRRVGTVAAPEVWRVRLAGLMREAGMARPVALLESCLAEVPMAIGYLRPAIVTPLGLLAGLPGEQVEAILLHELAHIRRADYLVNLLQIAAEGLLFYHPALWWVSGVVRAEREHCCDDWAAARLGDAHRYARALATLEESPWRTPRTAMAASGSDLPRRIRRLLAQPKARDLAIPVAPVALLVVSMGVALAAWSPDRPAQTLRKATSAAVSAAPLAAAPLAATPSSVTRPRLVAQIQQTAPAPMQNSGAASASSMGTPYQKWLDEDVVYIISREERAAYQSLLTDAEREQFIEQFWQRRDPTPGTPENEYKDEHYRRIAYANQNYSATDGRVPGWRTARGRFYIIYGPADEIDDHTNGSPAPYQMWRYRWVEGFGTNVQFRFSIDPTGNSHLTQIVGASPLASFEGAGDGQTIPGGHATIQVYPNGFTAFSIPRKFLTGQVDILGEVRTAEHVGVANFRDVAPAGDAPYTTILILEPGTYRFQVLVRENATGRIYTETMGFEVK